VNHNIIKQFRGLAALGAFGVMPLFGQFGFSFDPGSSRESVLTWEACIRWMESALPTIQHGAALVVFFWIAALLPMSVFRRMHPVIAASLRMTSVFIGAVCWWQSVIVTYRMLGWLCVATGLLFVGVGVVPLAVIATASKGEWIVFVDLMGALALTLISRLIARVMSNRAARLNLAGRTRTHYADDYKG
jgi:hypothetical protein